MYCQGASRAPPSDINVIVQALVPISLASSCHAKHAEMKYCKGRTIRKVMGGVGDFQFAGFIFFSPLAYA